MRTAFSDALVAAAQHDPRVMLLTGDHGYALFDPLRKACPDRYLNAGIAEQNMIGVAAGMAKAGMRPIVYGLMPSCRCACSSRSKWIFATKISPSC